MTIARPSQARAYGEDVYRLQRLGCFSRQRLATASRVLIHPNAGLRLGHKSVGITTKRGEVLRSLPQASVTLVEEVKAPATSAVKVRIFIQHQVPFGQVLKVVGASPAFGNWQPQSAQELQWTDGHLWTVELSLEAGSYEFKCVTAVGDNILAWESGNNRILQVPGGVKGIRVDGTWSRTADSRVTVTEPIAAASQAARQKRAAAARLLVKALAEVNAAAAATGPPAAATAGGRKTVSGAAGAAAAAHLPAGGEKPGSKVSAAAVLEEEALEALKELKALVSPEPLGIGNLAANGGDGNGSSNLSISGSGSNSSSPRSVDDAKEGRGVEAGAGNSSVSRSNVSDPISGSNGGKADDDASRGGARVRGSWREAAADSGKQQQEQKAPGGGAAAAIARSIRDAAVARGEPVPVPALAPAPKAHDKGPFSVAGNAGSPGDVLAAAESSALAVASVAAAPADSKVPVSAKAQEPSAPGSAKAPATVDKLRGSAAQAPAPPPTEPAPPAVAAAAGEAKAATDGPASAAAPEAPAGSGADQAAAGGTRAAARSGGLRLANLLGDLGRLGVKQQGAEAEKKVDCEPAADKQSEATASAGASADSDGSDAGSGSPRSSGSSSGGSKRRGFSWRLLSEEPKDEAAAGGGKDSGSREAEPAAVPQQQQQQEVKEAEAARDQAEEDSGASSRFARLLEAKLRQQQKQQPSAEQPQPQAKKPEARGEEQADGAGERKEKAEQQERKGSDVPQPVGYLAASAEQAAAASEPQVVPGGAPALAATAARGKEQQPGTPPAPGPVAALQAGHTNSSRGAGSGGGGKSSSDSAISGDSKPNGASNAGKEEEEEKAEMGGASSRAAAAAGEEVVNDARLDNLLDAWEAAWSRSSGASKGGRGASGGGAVPQPQPIAAASSAPSASVTVSSSSSSSQPQQPSAAAAQANGGGAAARPLSGGLPVPKAADGGQGSKGQQQRRSGLSVALGAAAAAAAAAADKITNGGPPGTAPRAGSGSGSSAPGPSSGESLFDIAERLTANAQAAPLPTSGGDDTPSPGITMRSGAMAAMGVDRQGSYDTRSSYLSQSLLTDSVNSGGGGSGQEQNAASLLRQLRAANAANASSAPAAMNGNTAAPANGGVAANGAAIPPLPATPAPPGILSNGADDEEEEEDGRGVALPLPATPPPPSYLSGGAGSGAVGPVPPLPATPVPPSVLSGSLGGVAGAAEDLLRRAADADAVLKMLRGNLPLTPVARGGRGGGAGPLSMAEDEEEEEEDGGGEGSGRGRRGARGPALKLGKAKGQRAAEPTADPAAAGRAPFVDAMQAYQKIQDAIRALQESAGQLGLSPGAVAESTARLMQQLPKLEGPNLGGLGLPLGLPPPAGQGQGPAADGSAPPQPPSGLTIGVTQIATNLVSGLGAVGSSLTEQLRRSGSGAAGVGAESAGVGGGGADVSGGVGNGGAGGLLGGLLSSLVGGGSSLPPGCMRLVAGAHMIPHVDKVDKGGEDAYFISRVGLGGVGVADGVSGWADEGIDPAEYPRTLMRYAADAYEAARGTLSAQDIIRYAQYRTYLKGSSTVCMALMKPGRLLEVANVGDSGVRILRGGKVIFGTEAQQHAFNMPFQLSHPNNVEDPDSADDADVHLVEVQEGDVVMLATDGLFDNVFDEEIEQIVAHQLRELAAAGRGKAPPATAMATATVMASGVTATAADAAAASAGGGGAAAQGNGASGGGSSGGGGGGRAGGGRGLLSQSLNAAAAAAAAAAGNGAGGGGASGGVPRPGVYRQEDAARVARALAERAHMHARNPTQRTPWSVTSSQQPNFMWAKFFAKGGGKMDDCTVLVAFVCGPE